MILIVKYSVNFSSMYLVDICAASTEFDKNGFQYRSCLPYTCSRKRGLNFLVSMEISKHVLCLIFDA